VVTFYGGKKARDMAMKYELYPNGCSDLRAHVVVTSYEGPTDDSSRSFFRKVKWAGLIVDEGQRLKNDQNQLYVALKALKIPYQVLLTGLLPQVCIALNLADNILKALLYRTTNESCSIFSNFSTNQ
jgi:SNF2 family DNA or RNA helicase